MESPNPQQPSTSAELSALVGIELGPTGWIEVDQAMVNAFAEVTGDHQWIHVDPERAAASPLGGTIAHGLLTLSLGPRLAGQLLSFRGFTHALNYGYDKVRFPSVLPVGSKVRMRLTVAEVQELPGGINVVTTQTVEREGAPKPVLVAQAVARVVAA